MLINCAMDISAIPIEKAQAAPSFSVTHQLLPYQDFDDPEPSRSLSQPRPLGQDHQLFESGGHSDPGVIFQNGRLEELALETSQADSRAVGQWTLLRRGP